MPLWEIITGRDCNMRCSYCYAGEQRSQHNTPEQVEAFLCSAYAEYLRHRTLDPPRLLFIGGEPLLHPELIDTALTFFHEQSIKNHLPEVPSSIVTNGTLVGENREVRSLLERWRDKLRLSFSIDGSKETHDSCRIDARGRGSWDRAIAGYRAAREILGNHACGVTATFSKSTVAGLPDGVIALFEAGFDRVNANMVHESTWEPEEAGYVYTLFRPVMNYLLAGRSNKKRLRQLDTSPIETGHMTQNLYCSCYKADSMCLGLDGLVYGCHRMAVASHLHPHKKVIPGGFEVLAPDLARKGLEVWKRRPLQCLSCSLGNICSSCVNSIFEYDFDDPSAFHRTYSMCGWTKGVYAARLEFLRRIQGR